VGPGKAKIILLPTLLPARTIPRLEPATIFIRIGEGEAKGGPASKKAAFTFWDK